MEMLSKRARAYLLHHIRLAWRYYSDERKTTAKQVCSECGAAPPSLADHKYPVVDPKVGFIDWNTYIDRMFNGELQPLCKEDHDKKTKEENRIRRGLKGRKK
jgi:ribosomal protein S27AE